MKIGIIAEGKTDIAVIQKLLKGVADIEGSDTIPIRPSMARDETDEGFKNQNPDVFGSWTNVKNDCESGDKIEAFFTIEDQKYITIHLDTAEVSECQVNKPDKRDHQYCEKLRELVIGKISEWLKNKYSDKLLYAIAIEEIEAWLLVLYTHGDSVLSANPKEKLDHLIQKTGRKKYQTYEAYLKYAHPFSKKKVMKNFEWKGSNKSLELFCKEIDEKLNKSSVH